MHELLRQQLERLGLTAETPPDAEEWSELLEVLADLAPEAGDSASPSPGWSALHESVPSVFVQIDLEGRITDLERSLDGSPVERFVGTRLLDWIPVSHRAQVGRHLRETSQRGGCTSFETRGPARDGHETWWEVDVFALRRDGVVFGLGVLTRDVTERRRATVEGRLRQERLNALIDAIPDVIYRQDREGRVLELQPSDAFELLIPIERIVGRTMGAIQQEYPEVFPEVVAERAFDLLRRALDTGTAQTVEYSVGTPDGPRSYEVRLSPCAADEVLGLVRDVTERTRIRTARRRSEEKNRALLDAFPDLMFLLSSDGRFLEWKPATSFDPIVPPEQFLGRHLDEVLPPALVGDFKRLLRDVRPGEVTTWDYVLQSRHYEARLTACGAGALATIRDVTDAKRAESELRQSEALYANLFRHSTDGIVLQDASGTILDVNQRAEALFGWTKSELVGRPFNDLHPPGARHEFAARRMGRDGVIEFETRYLRKSGETFTAEVSANAFQLGDQRVVQNILRDVTERRHVEESLKAAKEQAERANRSKSQFLSNMSHELRTPLNAILGFGRVLDRGAYGPLNERQRQYLRDIINSGEHMLALVNNLLDLRRLEERHDVVRPIPIDLGPLLDEAISMVKPLVEEKHHELRCEIAPRLPLALADKHAVVRVAVNLLSNAVKYTRLGGHVVLRVRHDGNHLTVEVQDSGVGIAPEHQTRIFNYFEQVHGSEHSAATGTGIGLALSRELVERMGGAIGVRSEPDRGSVFYFTLPCADSDAHDEPAPRATSREPS